VLTPTRNSPLGTVAFVAVVGGVEVVTVVVGGLVVVAPAVVVDDVVAKTDDVVVALGTVVVAVVDVGTWLETGVDVGADVDVVVDLVHPVSAITTVSNTATIVLIIRAVFILFLQASSIGCGRQIITTLGCHCTMRVNTPEVSILTHGDQTLSLFGLVTDHGDISGASDWQQMQRALRTTHGNPAIVLRHSKRPILPTTPVP
jgi:hypothetical protein